MLCRGDFIRIGDFLLKFQQAETDETEATRSPSWNELESNPEYRALLETILAHPADDAPRLVLSDWLEEHDFPDIAGFIRMQLAEPAKIAGMDIEERSTATLAVCRLLLEKWFLLLGHHAWRWRFRRGFICEISLPCETFMAHARELFYSLPIEKVRLTDRMPNVSLQYYHQTGEIYSWMESSVSRPVEETPGAAIPEEIFRRLRTQGTSANDYSSAVEAIEALSVACVAHGRSLAGVG